MAKKICGEPFLRWQDVLSISRHAKERGLRMAIETNGTLINDELADALVQAGVSFISISLDGATAETHEAIRGVRGCYEDAVREIERLSSRGIHVQIITVLTKRNIHGWQDILELGKERGAGSAKFNLLTEIGRAESIAEDEKVLIEEYIRLHDEIQLKKDEFIQCLVSAPMAFKKVEDLAKGGINRGCPILNLLSVLADGSLSICGMGVHKERF
ncbi:TPA: radical SAM protein, partial [Candidatus Poribacteria bacterium]|nr:radical SAM protein [Candidatus Poribacteria bacterium]